MGKTNQLIHKMNYLSVGLMSGSSLDGLDMVLVSFEETDKRWDYEIIAADCSPFSPGWGKKLLNATDLQAREYLFIHSEFGKYCGTKVNSFLKKTGFRKKPVVIGSHGHTTFHIPAKGMTHQLGDGAAIAATTNISVVSDLRAMDVALGGQGAPIVPIGERLLFRGYRYFMNIGGICNISIHDRKSVMAFDVCPANRVLNMLANLRGKQFDKGGKIASAGSVNQALLEKLNNLGYYSLQGPKSLPNSFGTDTLYPMIMGYGLSLEDSMATTCEHIAMQIFKALLPYQIKNRSQILVTGGGAWNAYLVRRIQYYLDVLGIDVVIPGADTVNYKEALIMAFIAVLRLREEDNVLSSVTGAIRNSCGGALWSVK